MFLILIPRLSVNLEFHLLDIDADSNVRTIINDMIKQIFHDSVFVTDFCNLQLDDFKRLSYNQVNTFQKIFFKYTKDKFDSEKLDQVFITLLKEGIELIYSIDPNSQGIENAVTQSRREFRGNSWLNDYDTYRHITENVLLNLEKMTNSQIPAVLFYFAKSIEQAINELVEMRSKGVVNLIYVDSQFVIQKRGEEYSKIVATLSLDQSSKTASLKFHNNSNLIERQSAQRLAYSVVKFGFEMSDKTRVGMNFTLEVQNSEFK